MASTEVGVEPGWGQATLSRVWEPDSAGPDAAWERYEIPASLDPGSAKS